MGSAAGRCSSTGSLPLPDGGAAPAPVVVAPAAPTGLTASAGDATVTLAWTASSGATGYNVKSNSASSGPYQTIATGLTTTGATLTGLINGTTYYYVVSATNTAGQSPDSTPVSASPVAPVPVVVVPAAPTGLTAVAGNATVTLAWTASSGATGYIVKSSSASGGPYQTIATGLTTTGAKLTGLTNGATYYYVVSATNTAGQSSNSSPASATPVAPVITNMSIWWPTDGAKVGGTQPFKARISSLALSAYKMYWQVDGGQLNLMWDSKKDAPHKEASVNVSGWYWRGNGPYVITFVAKDPTATQVLTTESVRIYIGR